MVIFGLFECICMLPFITFAILQDKFQILNMISLCVCVHNFLFFCHLNNEILLFFSGLLDIHPYVILYSKKENFICRVRFCKCVKNNCYLYHQT